MTLIAQLLGGILGWGLAWSIWKIFEMYEQRSIKKQIEEVRKQYNK